MPRLKALALGSGKILLKLYRCPTEPWGAQLPQGILCVLTLCPAVHPQLLTCLRASHTQSSSWAAPSPGPCCSCIEPTATEVLQGIQHRTSGQCKFPNSDPTGSHTPSGLTSPCPTNNREQAQPTTGRELAQTTLLKGKGTQQCVSNTQEVLLKWQALVNRGHCTAGHSRTSSS